MTNNPKVEELRNEILDLMEEIEQNHRLLTSLLTEIRGIHPLDPPSDAQDMLIEGLDFDQAIFLKEQVRAWCAAYLVKAIWMGDSVATGVGSGRMLSYRAELDALRAQGGEVKRAIDQLTRLATAVERGEKAQRARQARIESQQSR